MINTEFINFNEAEICEILGLMKCDLPNEYLDSWEGILYSPNLKLDATSTIKNFLLL